MAVLGAGAALAPCRSCVERSCAFRSLGSIDGAHGSAYDCGFAGADDALRLAARARMPMDVAPRLPPHGLDRGCRSRGGYRRSDIDSRPSRSSRYCGCRDHPEPSGVGAGMVAQAAGLKAARRGGNYAGGGFGQYLASPQGAGQKSVSPSRPALSELPFSARRPATPARWERV